MVSVQQLKDEAVKKASLPCALFCQFPSQSVCDCYGICENK